MPAAELTPAELHLGKCIALRFFGRRHNSVARHTIRNNNLKHALKNVARVRRLLVAGGTWVERQGQG
jgi:hypothetical protein